MEGNADDNKERNTISPMTEVIESVKDQGYTKEFIVTNGKLKEMGTENTYEAQGFHLTNEYRFEGTSDPEYMGILYTIESKEGNGKGYLTSAYGGANDDTTVHDFIKKMEKIEGRDLNENKKF